MKCNLNFQCEDSMIAGFLFLLLANSFAAEPNCSILKSHREFYQCTLMKHPDLEISKLKIAEGEALLKKASQWQNPELEYQDLRGKSSNESVSSSEVVLSFPVSQLWVNGARQDVGKAEKKIAEIESAETLLNVKKALIRDIYRIRQLQQEIHVFEESIQAFETIRKQFQGRPARGPEQEITLGLVEIAASDYELKKNQLISERAEILSKFKALWGPSFEFNNNILPKPKDKWPEVNADSSASQSFAVRKVVLEAERAQAEASLTEKESLPDVRIGPAFEQANDGVEKVTSYGVNLSMSLPIFSLNSGARQLASTRSRQASLISDFTQKKAQLERNILLQKYRSAVASLKQSDNLEEVHKKHEKVEKLFRQGLISGALVIEAHRQITEFTESQHQQELLAIETYLELKAISGGDIEEIL